MPTGDPAAAILERMTDAVLAVDRAWRVTYANPAAARLLGRQRDDLPGAALSALFPGDSDGAILAAVRRAARSGVAVQTQADGDRTGIRLDATVDPSPDGFTVVVRGVGERRAADEPEHALERAVRRLADANLVGVGFGDAEGRLTAANDELLRMMGRSRADIESGGIDWAACLAPEFRADVGPEAERLRREGAAAGAERVFLRPDGGRTPFLGAAALVGAGEDRLVRLALDRSGSDVAEGAVRASEDQLRLLADAMPQVVWVADPAGAVRYYNRRVEGFAGARRADDGAWAWEPLLHPDDLGPTLEAWQRAVAERCPYAHTHRIRMADGAFRWHLSRAVPVFDGTGAVEAWYGSATDVHDLTRTGQELEQQRRAFASLAEHLPDVVARLDREGRHLYVNPATLAVTGLSLADYLGRTNADLGFPPALVALWDERLAAAFATGQEQRFAFDFAVAAETRFFESRFVPERGADGHVETVLVVSVDVTERRLAEARLRRLALLVDLSHEAIFVWDPLDGIVEWNAGAERLYGYARDEAMGQISHRLLGTTHPLPMDALLAAIRRDGGWAGEVSHVTRDGRTVVVESRQQLVEAEGRPLILETNRDVTDRRRVEAALRGSEERLRLALAIADAGTWDWDVIADRVVGDEHLARLFGLPAADVVAGRLSSAAFLRTIPEDDRARVEARLGDAFARGGAYEVEYGVRADGGERWLASRGRVELGDDGGPRRVTGLVFDASSRRRAEEERVAFLDALAHDVKNPLAAAKGQAQLLRRRLERGDNDPGRLQERLAGIEDATDRATDLIDEMLDVARLRAGQPLELRLGATDLVALARAAADEAQQGTTIHRVRVEAAASSLVGPFDGRRLERVLANLLSNALKYSPDGGEVTVRVGTGADAAGSWAAVAVADRGVGIPAADVPHLFARFRRGGNVAGRIAGSGVGLAGAHQIVEAHGGTIAVESREGAGSTFTVRLPLPEARPSADTPIG